MIMMEVTVRQLIEASEKNGFKWGRATESAINIYPGDENCATFSCVVGQGMANLKNNERTVNYIFPDSGEASYLENEELGRAFEDVYKYNDTKATSYEDALRYMKERLAPYLDEKVWI